MELQRKTHRCFVSFFSLLLILFFTSAYAGEVTRLSGVPALKSMKKFYAVPNFKIGGDYEVGNESAYEFGGKGGVTLESMGEKPLRVAYIAVGNEKKDENGKITNAVIINPYYTGDSTFDYFFWYEGQKGNDFCKVSAYSSTLQGLRDFQLLCGQIPRQQCLKILERCSG